eukprot:366444-Chlamydomonas_euryale.AAC.26
MLRHLAQVREDVVHALRAELRDKRVGVTHLRRHLHPDILRLDAVLWLRRAIGRWRCLSGTLLARPAARPGRLNASHGHLFAHALNSLLVQAGLHLGHVDLLDLLLLCNELRRDLALEAPQNKGREQILVAVNTCLLLPLIQPAHVHLVLLFEVVRLKEQRWHEELKQRTQLLQAVLQRGARQKQTVVASRRDLAQLTCAYARAVFERVCLVGHQVRPAPLEQECTVLDIAALTLKQRVRRQHDIKRRLARVHRWQLHSGVG